MNHIKGWLVFDTETTGIPNRKLPADDPSQPRIAAISVFVTDPELHLKATLSQYVKPEGWVMPPEITKYNNITQAHLEQYGEPLEPLLQQIVAMIDDGYVLAAYGAAFDMKMLRGELRRRQIPDRFETSRNVCIMLKSMGVVVKPDGKRGMPKLVDAVAHFKIKMPPAPVGSPKCWWDALACLEVMRWLRQIGRDLTPEVHYASGQSDQQPTLPLKEQLQQSLAVEEKKSEEPYKAPF